MAKLSLGTVSNIGGNPNSAANTLNENARAISEEFENTLSRDGSAPNQMLADLDMNHNRVINVGSPENGTDAVRLVDIQNGITGTTLTIPSLSGNSGKSLHTDGFTAFWSYPESEFEIVRGIDPLGGDHSPLIQAALNTGKSVWLPPGNITIETPLELKFSGQILSGSGMHRTNLVPYGDFSAGGVIHIAPGTEGCQVRDVGFRGDNMTGGKVFNIQQADRVLLSNISSHYVNEVAYVRQCNLVVFDNHWHNQVDGTAANNIIYLDSGNPAWRSDVIVFNNFTASTWIGHATSNRPNGLLVSGNVHTVICQGMRFIQPQNGLRVVPGVGTTFPATQPAFFQFDDFEVDYPYFYAIDAEAGSGFWFSNSYLCNSVTTHGVALFEGAHYGGFTNCIIRGNRGHGIYIDGTDFKFNNCHISLNSWGNFGVNSGVFCDSDSARISFSSSLSGAEFGSGATQQWGIISAGGSESISWVGGHLGGNIMGSWLDNAGTGNNSLEVSGATGSTMGRINDVLLGTSNGWGGFLQPTVSSGTISSIGIVNGGKHYSTPPAVVIFDPTGAGSGAAATCTVLQGRINSVTVTNPGSGYSAQTVVYVTPTQTLPSIRPYNQSTFNVGLQVLAKGTDTVRIGNDLGVGIEIGNVLDAADDAAAAGAGIKIGQMYRTGNALKIRIS